MKNRLRIHKICLGILLSIVSCLHVYAAPANSSTELRTSTATTNTPPGSSTTDITICNNQLPYTWNGITCLAAGTFTATIPTHAGDSTAVLNLSVINVGTSITNAIVCTNDLPYTWNGNNYSTGGTYSVTLTSTSGCDSVPILSLTVNDVVTSTTNRTVCSNQLPFSWNGNNYPGAGIYSVILTSAAGCDSIATLNLAVRPLSGSTTNVSICNAQLPYYWNGNSYPSAGTYTVTLTAGNGCDSVATLNLSTNASVSSSTAVSFCNNNFPYTWNGNNYTAAGTYSVHLTSSSGCDSVATLVITTLPLATSMTYVTICSSQVPYSWNGNTYSSAGIYTVALTGSNGCDSIARLRLIIVTFLASTTDHTICDSELPFSWSGNSYAAAGTYSVFFTTPAGCDSMATLNLAVITPYVRTDSMIICENQLPYNYHGHIFTAPGDYEIVPPIVIDACTSVDSLNLVILTVVPSTTDITVCDNELPYNWNGNTYTNPGAYTVTLTSTSGCDSITNLNLVIIPVTTSITDISTCDDQLPYIWNGNIYNSTGTYIDTLTSANGCDSIVTLNLTVNPVIADTTDISICSTQIPFAWNGNNYISTGVYTVILTSTGGCDSLAILNLDVQAFLSSTTNINICSNLLPYSWNGNNYTGSGIYTINLVSNAGCDSVAILNLVVNPVITSISDIHICNTQLPYTWNGNVYTGAGIYLVTLVTSGGCDSLATLNLTVSTTVTSISTIAICNNQLPYSWNGNSYPVAGMYPVTLTSSSGCDSIATLDLLVTDILTSTTNITVCDSQLPYQWNGNSYPGGGTYAVTLTTPAGCDSVPILSLTLAPYVTSSTDITICNNELPYSWNGNSFPAAGTYSVLLNGTGACDSLATLNLAVNPPITSTTAVSICENLLPYTWNGNNYINGGIYSVTLMSSEGCDSVATLNLIATAIATSTTDITICENQLPYSWNGNSYSAGGVYTVTITGSSGCDSVATLNLTSHPVLTSTTVITICDNQLPYSWNGNSYPTAGIYIVTMTGSSGCDSVATLNLASNPVLTSTTNISICDNQLPYSWNGNSYPTAGGHSVILISSSGCDSIATLNLEVNTITSSTTNITTCSNQLPYSWNGNSYLAAGIYTVVLTGSLGCDSVATLNLFVNPVLASTTNASTCSNQLPYSWNGQSYTSAGPHVVTLTSAAGCDSVATLQLTINPVVTSTTTTSICSALLPYSWNGQSYTTAGLHVITLSSAAGCDSVATLDLTINPTPGLPAVTSPLFYCQYETTAPLIATVTTAGSHLLWYTSPTGGTGSHTTPIPSSITPGIMNYYVSEMNGPCEGPRALITVTVNSKPALGPDKPLRICFGQSANLSTLYDTTGYTSSWTLGQQPVINTATVTVAGTYQLVVQNSSGCSDTVLVDLAIQPPVIANAGNDDNAEYNVPYHLSGNGGGLYQWSPANVLNNPFIANPVAILTHDETFVLMVSDEIGCFDLDTVKLRVLKGPTFYVPTAFTPNGDGLNDIFRPTSVGILELDYFRVFNRYGELVFETHDIGKGWDGNYKGIKQSIGNYVWSIKGTDRTKKLKTMKGNVVLIR